MEQKITTDNFQAMLTVYRPGAKYIAKLSSTAFIIHFFLDHGHFMFGRPNPELDGTTLTIETSNKVFRAPHEIKHVQSGSIGAGLMLQILELLKALGQAKKDVTAIEIIAAALCSMAVNQACKTEQSINFSEMKSVYAVVQEWKEAKRMISGSFNLYKPDGMSRNRFLFLVHQLYNSTASEIIYSLNMQKALHLLLFSNELIISISERLGYASKENFITAFRNTYGVTPGHLRRQFRR